MDDELIDRTNALLAIQELHKPELWIDGRDYCPECSGQGETMPVLAPCKTRKLADEALGEDQ